MFPFHEPDGYPGPNDMVLEAAARSDGLLVPFCRVNPHHGALAEAERCARRRRPRDQAAPARRAVHARPPGRAPAGRARPRAHAAGADPRRTRNPGARPARRPARRGVSQRAADPRPRGHLRPVMDLARRRRPPEPAVRHRLVDAGRHAVAVLAGAARADRVRQRRSVRGDGDVGGVPAALGAAGRPVARADPLDRRRASRCGSPPASPCSPPARRSASTSGRRTCCSTASRSS